MPGSNSIARFFYGYCWLDRREKTAAKVDLSLKMQTIDKKAS
ncbi:hypothetical protein Enr17x_24070 [Gimesia fumaroli]|uniref:Uncharacterized protein n=1 Tax=Gimesia fumaroli TaxID=2527976 RepID=A0A518IB84_9PLAN|nr:hypothetical protein Enr17x_24070 [Gimesia fumaroli]